MVYYIEACLLRSPYFVTFAAIHVMIGAKVGYGHNYIQLCDCMFLLYQS